MRGKLAYIISVFIMLAGVMRAAVYAPISQPTDIKNGDEVVIAIQNGRFTSSWYAIPRPPIFGANNATSVNVQYGILRNPPSSTIWKVSIVNGNFVFYQSGFLGSRNYFLSNSNGWKVTSLAGNRMTINSAAVSNDTVIWRVAGQGVNADLYDTSRGDSVVFDQVALHANLTTGAYAFNIFKVSELVRFDPGEFGYLNDEDTVKVVNPHTGKITLPNCFSNSHHPFIGWATSAGSSTVDVGVAGTSITITHNQTFYAVFDSVEMPNQCFDYTNLYANYVTCRYASKSVVTNYQENYDAVGVRTGDPYDYDTHINVITNPYSTCDLVNGFYEVPNGMSNSIRLGNYVQGYGAEDIEYSVTVDTTQAPILLLRYLPVLETSHDGGAGMKLTILDEHNQPINPDCASFSFTLEGNIITGRMPGNPTWHTETDYYWHDWATLGVDLTPYHGQNIVIKIQTFDCDASGHKGFGYFNLSCQEKQINVYACGNQGDSLELTAPEGFFYKWYRKSNPSNILGTGQSLRVAEGVDSLYFCDLSVDEEFNCKFTLSAVVKRRYPVAAFTYDIHRGYCADTVYFHNNSFASPDGIVEFTPHEDCDYALWDFGDATTLSGTPPDVHEYFPSEPLIYSHAGVKTVKLKTCLKGWDCISDSTEYKFSVYAGDSYQITYDTICLGESFTFWDRELKPTRVGDHVYMNQVTTASCFDVITLEEHLFVTPKYEFIEYDTLCRGQELEWHGKLIDFPGVYYDSLTTYAGCDSVYVLNLAYRSHKVSSHVVYDTICSNEIYYWYQQAYRESGEYVYHFTDQYGCDSIEILNLFVRPIHGFIQDSILNPSRPNYWDDPYFNDTVSSSIGHRPGNWDDPYLSNPIVPGTRPPFWDDPYVDFPISYDTICEGEVYEWHSKHLVETGTYSDTLSNIFGCDSIIYIHLTVNPSYHFESDVTFWIGESYTWEGHKSDTIITTAGVYFDSLLTVSNCDSIYELRVSVNTENERTLVDTICGNDNYAWHMNGKDTILNSTGEYTDTLVNSSGGDSIVHLHLYVNPVTYSHATSTICEGDSAFWNDEFYHQEGHYIDTLVNRFGCDSILTFDLIVILRDTFVTVDTICQGQTYKWNSRSYTETSRDTILLQTASGCDSIDILDLFVIPTIYYTEVNSIFEGDSLFFYGNYIKSPGLYSKTITSVITGCDSVYTLELIVYSHSVDTYVYDTICRNEKFLGVTYDVDGDYYFVDSLSNVHGYDSIVYRYLHVNSIYDVTENAVICDRDSFVWHNVSYFVEGLYTDTLLSIFGCDSICHLDLKVKRVDEYTETIYICNGDSFLWHGEDLSVAGVYYDTLRYEQTGCDSIRFTMTLMVQTAKDSVEHDTICGGDVLSWHGQSLTESGTYYDTLRYAVTDCDSLRFQLELVRQDVVEVVTDTTLCEGDSELWREQMLSAAGVYCDTLRYTTGCDSIRYTHTVYIHSAKDSVESIIICDGGTATWHGEDLSVAGVYYDTLRYEQTGCDSIRFTMTLTVQTAKDSVEHDTICGGDVLSWHGQSLTESGTYYDTLRYEQTGCDSIRFTMTLTVAPVYDTTEYVTICRGETYIWHNISLTDEGSYVDTLSTIDGCDSICHLVIMVPEPFYYEFDTTLCDGSSIYFANQWISDAGVYQDSLLTTRGCDSIITMNVYLAYHMQGSLTVPDICADDQFIPVEVHSIGNNPTHYSVTFSPEAVLQGFVNEVYRPIIDFDSTVYIPVPHTEDRRQYPRPDYYSLDIVVYDTICCDSIASHHDFMVSYPSWITDVRWNDAIILFNDIYNGGYTFSDIQWYYNGEPIDGETKDFLYLVHTLKMGDSYQARLTRTDDGKTFFTCPVYPAPVEDSVLVSENYLCVVPTVVHKHNPYVDIQTNLSGRYYLYDMAGRLVDFADFVPCEHNANTVNLPRVAGMYIFYFEVNEDERHFPHKIIVW